ncbi:MAG: Stk1 family PASTA domain-containing Ser/Thr kinase [Lachnospiraceae bacterium]|nr:Stk1 family PASTA domain-containing Ser/Thr kinase [Lachnospiraceae bacterium]
MIKIGNLIGERYEILEKIGTGGMSDVYKARDQKLSRNVAVKVLKQEFAENENFVSKFRMEAQAAAGLMHPNIVNVYDVGEEGEDSYIVMELVEGITLKKYIEKKARLTYKEAVSIAIQVGLGIEAAHNNHIIHRDIKPQNIIISKDGKVKVTDFGIAKAATSNTITSNVMGSVHYTSPEQARGGYSDEKSDIYSLGVTLFEMLTGRVPFNGETTVAIAIKHIQEPMPSPREYVPEIPYSVEDIVLKCCEKSPDNRYASMHELVDDLKQSLLTPEEDFVVRNTTETMGGTRTVTEEEMAQIKSRSANYGYQEEYPEDGEQLRLASDSRYEEEDSERYEEEEGGYDPEEESYEDDSEYDYESKMERITTILAIVAGVVIVGIIIVLAIRILGNRQNAKPVTEPEPANPVISEEVTPSQTGSGTETADPAGASQEQSAGAEPGTEQPAQDLLTMPNVVGLNVDDARNTLFALGLNPLVEYVENATVEAGAVISASVEAGYSVAKGSDVTLMVSAGSTAILLPNVVGLSADQAEGTLTQNGFQVTRLEAYSDVVEAGKVVSQTPEAGSKAAADSIVTITISLGPEKTKIQVPNLVGLTEDAAKSTLTGVGLAVGEISYVFSNEIPNGVVCAQTQGTDQYLDTGSQVSFQVSKGPQQKTYKADLSIGAPTVEEAPDYISGTEVLLKLVGADGAVILETRTSTFPFTANYTGLTSASGTLTISYNVQIDGAISVDDLGNVIMSPGTTDTKTITRTINFVEE